MYCLREPSLEEDSHTRMCINDWKNLQEIEKVGQEMKGSRSLASSIYHGRNEEISKKGLMEANSAHFCR